MQPLFIDQQIMTKYKNIMMRYIVLAAIILLINSLTIHRTQFFTHSSSIENPLFTLSLQYGSLDRFEAEQANAQIFWNTQKIGTLTPEDQQVQTFSARVKVVQGKNKLTIKGSKSTTGIIIDNIKLTREGTSDNIIQNGDFEKKFPAGLKSVNTFPGWAGEPTVANGNEQNKRWPSTKVALIGSDPKQAIVQNFNFDRQYRLLTSRYFLSFKYAAQVGSSLNSALGKVRWNDQVFSVEPTDFAVHEFKQEVTILKNTLNTLKFTGQGTPDGFGLTIDNVRLVGLGSLINLVINGEFQMPHIKGQTQNLNILPGWQSANKEITIGVGSYFSKNWGNKTGQVLTLDNNENLIIDQAFNFGADFSYIPKEKPYFIISFNYAKFEGVPIEKSKGQLLLDNEVIAQFSPDNDIVNSFREKIPLKPGNNEFTLRPQKGNTIVVSDFKIARQGQEQNIANNGNFTEPDYDGFIVGWSGSGQVLDSQKANNNWKNSRVVVLSSEKHNKISQGVLLNKDFGIKTNKFILQFDFVPTANAQLQVPLAQVSWNGKVFNIIAHHRKLHNFKIPIVASRGQNLLTLEGQGKNGEGVTVDNIKFTPYGSSSKLLSNGDFQDPQIKGGNFKQSYVISEWDGHNLEVGLGERYSEFWPEANGQVLSLATPHKTVISKIVSLSQQLSIFDHEPRDFKLTFKYAAQEGKPLDKSGGEIFWNKVLIGDIVPTNYKINSYAINLKAKPGINKLFIKGAGGLEAYGLTLNEVQLHRQGSKDNLIENSQFELPPTPGWNSIVNHGPLLNHHWGKTHVARIDAVQNLTLSKKFEFDSRYIYKTKKFILKFKYALHKDGKVGQSEGSCLWNKQNFKIKPQDDKVQRFEAIVFASNGQNKLSFEGEGITIDDVRLVPWGSSLSVLLNGGFEDPQFSTTSFDGLPSGWSSESIQFTKGYHASTQWPYFSNQVITLAKRNNYVSQYVILSKQNEVIQSEFPAHELELDFSAVDDSELESSKGEIYWNNRLIGTLVPTQEGVNKFIARLYVVPGVNTLTFKGLESGIFISNIDFVRYTLLENIIQNGQFKQNVVDSKIPSWEGSAQIFDSSDYSESWKSARIAFLKNGDSISQSFTFDGNLRLVTNKFVLNFQYTVRQGVKFQTAKARVIWNDQIYNLAPTDYDLHLFSEIVHARKGNNFIIFESNGVKRHFGTFAEGFTLDDVWIRSYGSAKNLLINGGFEQPKIEGFDYGMFTSIVPGWTTKDIYLGVGYYFSKNWVDTQIIELDGNHENAKIMQGIKMGKNWEIIQ